MINKDDYYDVFMAMANYGGAFARTLAVLWFHADQQNAAKILATWPELIDEYRGMALQQKAKVR